MVDRYAVPFTTDGGAAWFACRRVAFASSRVDFDNFILLPKIFDLGRLRFGRRFQALLLYIGTANVLVIV